jgi:hypothetical protein
MIPRELALHFQLDTNRINSRGRLEFVNRLESWARTGLIEILLSQPAHEEASAGMDQARRSKAYAYIFTLDMFENPDETSLRRQLEATLFPGGAITVAERNDVRIVAHARKHMAHLVTADGGSKRQPGGILGRRAELAALGVSVMTDEEAVCLVEAKIRRRDEGAVRLAQVTGEPVPDWVGKD